MATLPKSPAPTSVAEDTAIRHQVYLERLGTEVSKRVADLSARVVDITVDTLNDWGLDLSDCTADDLSELLATARAQQTAAMLAALGELSADLEKLAGYETAFAVKELQALSRKVKAKSLKAGEAYQAALTEPLAATGEQLDEFLDGWTKKQIKQVNGLISQGYTNGMTNQQIIRAMVGSKAQGYKDGLVTTARRNAEAITRTSIQHVAATARRETWARNSDIVKEYMLSATLDGNTTTICRSLDHKRFPIGKGPKVPLHLRCRTAEVPVLDPKYDALSEGLTRAAVGGSVDSKLSYYDWLKTQPEEFQDSAIGPTRAKLLRDGGLSADAFAKLQLHRNFEPMTLDEMRKVEPLAFKRAGI